MTPVSSLLQTSNLNASDIAKVILTGGTTKVTKVQTALSNMFSQAELLVSLAPDEVIAIGAAVQASYVSKDVNPSVQEKLLALSKNIIVFVEGKEDDELVVIVQDSTLPVKRSVQVQPVSDSDRISVSVCWGHKSAVLSNLSLSSIDTKSKITLSMHIHRDGSSHITLADKSSGKSVDTVLKAGA